MSNSEDFNNLEFKDLVSRLRKIKRNFLKLLKNKTLSEKDEDIKDILNLLNPTIEDNKSK